MDGAICCDNRFKIIEKARQYILENTNIESSPDEMRVLGSFLFRCWQMGWLEQFNDEDTDPYEYHEEFFAVDCEADLIPLEEERKEMLGEAFKRRWDEFNQGYHVTFRKLKDKMGLNYLPHTDNTFFYDKIKYGGMNAEDSLLVESYLKHGWEIHRDYPANKCAILKKKLKKDTKDE